MGTYKWTFPQGMISQINSEKIKLTPAYSSPYETDGAFDVKVVNGATAAVYTITCTTESCETTGKLTIKDCSGGGGGCSDFGVTIKETVTQLTKDGGEIVFEHGTVPEPTPTGDDETLIKNTVCDPCNNINTIVNCENNGWGVYSGLTTNTAKIRLTNNSTSDFLWNGRFVCTFNNTDYDVNYRDASYRLNSGPTSRYRHCSETNMIFKVGDAVDFTIPLNRRVKTVQDTYDIDISAIVNASFSNISTKIYFSGVYQGRETSGPKTVNHSGLNVSYDGYDNGVYKFKVTGSTNYNMNSGNSEIKNEGTNMAYLHHGDAVVPLNMSAFK